MFNEVKIRVAAEAMPWFEKYGDLDVAYERTRMYEDEDNWGYGTPDSPHACLIRGYIGLRLGKEEGKEDLQLALESGCFASLAAEIEAYLQTKEV
ncbi:MAG: hypothetical protein H7Y17_05520 [Chlorobia bacterium]|nr:hypothetical protein [Fimbriimonadaceae bacterium]